MKYRIGDYIRVRRGIFECKCKIVAINFTDIYLYKVTGTFIEGWISDKYIVGYWED